ncbi:hypothetical protein AB0M02_45720 [Actinoplanes sp. NPDC051861]|uniref:hypothetical protein n=1 Tax=Actinoplanes sp. NPDC051861 TaxID=3155170 RepID=UPI00341D1733
MADWVLVPCLVQLRTELNRIAPDRDKTSDGTIGDRAHQATVSDHNDDEVGRVPIYDADSKHEVHAFDADDDLRTPNLTMEMVVQHILARSRSGAENRLRYIIYNRRIWEASNRWKQRAYTGSSPHTEHAHFSASYVTSREANTTSWRLEDIPVALTDADKRWLTTEFTRIVDARLDQLTKPRPLYGPDSQPDGTVTTDLGNASWQQGVPNAFIGGKRTTAYELLGDIAEAVSKP